MGMMAANGSARVFHHSYLIKVTWVTCEKSVHKFHSTKHRRFSPSSPVSSSSNTGPTRGGVSGPLASLAYRVIQNK